LEEFVTCCMPSSRNVMHAESSGQVSAAPPSRDQLAGVGVVFESKLDSHTLVVRSVSRDGPASSSDIRQGDRLIAIDDCEVADMTEGEIAKHILGPPGSQVQLTLRRRLSIGKEEDVKARLTRGSSR